VLRDGATTAAPVVEAEVGIGPRRTMRVPLLGLDPIRGATAFRMGEIAPTRGTDLARLVVEPGTVLLPEELARELGLAVGDSTILRIGERERPSACSASWLVAATSPPSRRSWLTSPRHRS
jgi:hypothetical protein